MDEKAYQAALLRLAYYEQFFKTRKTELVDQEGLTDENAEFALNPARLLYEQLKWDVEQYEKSKCGD